MEIPMDKNISKESLQIDTKASQPVTVRVGLLVLICFALIRPVSLIGGEDISFFGIKMLDIFGVFISYLLVVPILACLRKLPINRISFLILVFCLYAAMSLAWGSTIHGLARTILPFLLFFSVRLCITDSNKLKTFLVIIVIAFVIPIIVSTVNVMLDRSIEMIERWNQLPRHTGGLSSSHTLAYNMLFFSFLYCILNYIYKFINIYNRLFIYLMIIFSFYCLYQSHTRTVYIGFMIFWFIYLWGNNKKLFYGAILLSVVVGIIFHSHVLKIFFKTEQFDVNTATSGRAWMVEKNIQLFFDSSLTQQMVGRGLGHKQRFPFHNDYVALLISLGIVGLILHFILFFYLFLDIFLLKNKKLKYLFGAILISVCIMNFGSNAVIFRVELSQFFWLIIGLFYNIEKLEEENTA
jgi:hypothetical protein